MNQKQINYIASRIKAQTNHCLEKYGLDRKTCLLPYSVAHRLDACHFPRQMTFEQWWKVNGSPMPTKSNLETAIKKDNHALSKTVLFPGWATYLEQHEKQIEEIKSQWVDKFKLLIEEETKTLDDLFLGTEEQAKLAITNWDKTISNLLG